MVRTFQDAPVEPDVVERILAQGQRAPSAGYTQGFEFLLLRGPGDADLRPLTEFSRGC